MAIPLPVLRSKRAYHAPAADDAPDHVGIEVTADNSYHFRVLRAPKTLHPLSFPCMAPGSNTYTGCRGNACAAFEDGAPRKGCVFYTATRAERERDAQTRLAARQTDETTNAQAITSTTLAATAKIVNRKTAPDRQTPHIWTRAANAERARKQPA